MAKVTFYAVVMTGDGGKIYLSPWLFPTRELAMAAKCGGNVFGVIELILDKK